MLNDREIPAPAYYDAATYARALAVAQAMKPKLQERILGSFGSANPAKTVEIDISPLVDNQRFIARAGLWTCTMRGDKGRRWTSAIHGYISLSELIPLFRNAFAGIDVQHCHAFARLFDDKVDPIRGDRAGKAGRKFTGSGRTVQVKNGVPVFVRPVGDLTQSLWLDAELRVDVFTAEERATTKEPVITCQIDPFAFGQKHGHGAGHYFAMAEPSDLATFYIPTVDANSHSDIYLPIVRLVAADKTTGEATFELDQSVETFVPAVK